MLRRRMQTVLPEPPTPTRFDAWGDRQVFDLLETSVSETTVLIQRYRSQPDAQDLNLSLLEVELRQAHLAVQSLRRRRE